jgi:hypothetical protein
MDTRKWVAALIGILGGLGAFASLGESVTELDVLIGAGTCWAIAYGIGTMIMKSKSSTSRNTAEKQYSRDSLSPRKNLDASPRATTTKKFRPDAQSNRWLRKDGWYQDPKNYKKLRYFHQGEWTSAVSDSNTDTDKSAAIAKFLPHLLEHTALHTDLPKSEDTGNSEEALQVEKESNLISQRVEQLERLAKLRETQMISEEEFELLKKQIIHNFNYESP